MLDARWLIERGNALMACVWPASRLLLCAASTLALAGCAGAEIRERARSGAEPPKPFHTDGCSVVPDLDIRACCEQHDFRYWRGGSCVERRQADVAFAACIVERNRPLLAKLYFAGVRVGGAPIWPVPWRWGFGWPYGVGCFEQEAMTEKTVR
jgi:hypothetical protein